MMTKLEIAGILKDTRKKSGLTQKQLAASIGKSQQVVGNWETGYSQPDISTLFALFDIFGVSMDETFLRKKKK